jgi:hypothetical protein
VSEVVVVGGEPEPQTPVSDGGVQAGVAAGAALVTAEAAAEEAAEAVVVAEGAAEIAEAALDEAVRCCVHCEGTRAAVDALETRGAMEQMVEETPVLDVPAPEVKETPKPKAAAANQAPKARKGFWPV